MNHKTLLPPELVEEMIKDKKVRVAITKESHWYFFHFYFAHYVIFPTAKFQAEIFDLTEDESIGNFFIVAFRGSGKSTILTTSYPIWAILGRQQKKFVLILCQTQAQAKQHMMNLRRELEGNALLKRDLGPFHEESDEWGSSSLVFSNLNARITAASSEQSIRGLRHNQYRPDLIIGDDVEDLASTKTREGRNKTYQWLTAEVIPAGDRHTRLVIVGNLLHEDSLLMRIKTGIEKGEIDGTFREYPLVLGENILWPGKYPSMEDVEAEKRKSGNEYAWQREYLLRIIPDTDQVVYREWIQPYDVLPPKENCRITAIAIDPAISERDTADYTAMVIAKLYGYGKDSKIYILPNPVNERLNFPRAIARVKALVQSLQEVGTMQVFVEDIAYQRAFPQALEQEGIRAEAVPIGGQDKRARLNLTTHLMQQGRILFPLHGAEHLVEQIVGFGVEKHDDLVDAFTLLILRLLQEINRGEPQIIWLGCDDCDNGTHGQGWRPLSW